MQTLLMGEEFEHKCSIMAPATEKQHLDNALVARIAALLEDAGIPNVLWGNYLLRVFGVPTVVQVCQLYSRSITKREFQSAS